MTRNGAITTIVSILAILLLVGGTFFTMGGIINTQSKNTIGLYWKVDKPLTVGNTVLFCPPNLPEFQEARVLHYISEGSCPDNFENMILKVAAKYNDTVTINNSGVFVNNIQLPQSKPNPLDPEGRRMPAFKIEGQVLKENELLLMSESDDSFDGRYFGLIHTDQIDSVVSPLLMF